MKIFKILVFLSLFSNLLFAQINSSDKEILENLYNEVILINSKKALNDVKILSKKIDEKNSNEIKLAFKELIKSWKSIEAFYLLGEIDEDYIDIPRLIDIFHNGNEDIKKQLDLALNSKDDVKTVLFKNSLKSINALEYIIFTKDLKDERANLFAKTITNRIQNHLKDINDSYIEKKDDFLSNIKKANSIVINSLIQNSYKLLEWRVGDVSGLTKKYENKADNKRSEYYISKSSVLAIKSILKTYKNILNNPNFKDYGDYLFSMTDGKEMKRLLISLDKSLKIVSSIKNDNLENQKELYKEINKIHVILFVDMIEDLQINAKILDADGD